MNDKDKEEFYKWINDRNNCYADALAYEFEKHLCFASWQAACEYKKEKFDAYVRKDEMIKSLEAENKKLREALEKIDNSNDDMKYFNSDINKIISETREALKEDEGA